MVANFHVQWALSAVQMAELLPKCSSSGAPDGCNNKRGPRLPPRGVHLREACFSQDFNEPTSVENVKMRGAFRHNGGQ